MIVVRNKVSRGIEPFSPMGIDSAESETSQSPNGEFCMDKSSRLLSNTVTQPGSSTVTPLYQ